MSEEFLNRIENELNAVQLEAVRYVDGPSLVIAGAGSGKTRVLTYKIAYLLQQGLSPWNILALTFTNKAAREMKERIAALVGDELSAGLWMGTFHSVFSRILRREADKIGFSPRFTIYDQADSRSLVKAIVKEMGLDENTYKPAAVASQISNAKNRLLLPSAYQANNSIRSADDRNRIPQTGAIYVRYMERLRKADAMDFDDLLLHTYYLLKEHPDVCRHYAEKFDFVLVDEYQDTNFAQHCIVWELTRQKQKVCVVGDDAQSIYSFRGANIENILGFSEKYADTKVFKLEQNYRSTQTIVSAANSLIRHNMGQIPKEVFSEQEKGDSIRVFAAYSDTDEAEIVANNIAALRKKEDMEFDDFAILYRTNAQSRSFEEVFRKRGIPYRIYGGLSFYQRKEIKDVIAYCRLAVNPHDEEAFKRVVNYPARGIGQTTLGKVAMAAITDGSSLWDVAREPGAHGLELNKGTQAKLQAFTGLVKSFMDDLGRLDAASLVRRIVEVSGIRREILQDGSPEGLSRRENVEELLNGVDSFVDQRQEEGNPADLGSFLQEVSLQSDLDEDDGEGGHKVTLMTIHSAKGLEFPAVFVVGMEENLFPSPMVGESRRALEEERRLFYVALTRAERFCFLSFARSRFRFGKTDFCNPSRFLHDIDIDYLDMGKGGGSATAAHRVEPQAGSPSAWGERRVAGKAVGSYGRVEARNTAHTASPVAKPKLVPASRASASASSGQEFGLHVGSRIEHQRFGLGVVKAIEGGGENTKATVDFQNAGQKQLLLRFARFKVLDD